MITRLRAQFKRLRWKLTWSYTWVAALTFLVIETALLILLMSLIGFNPLRRDIKVFNDIVAPVLADDIRPITMAYLRNQPVDTAALQADLEQILGIEPLTTSSSPFEIEQFASVFVLDAQQHLLASTPQYTTLPPDGRPQYTALPPDGRFFDPTLLTGDDSLVPLITAAYAGEDSLDQPYAQDTPESLYLVFVEPLSDEDGRLLGVEVAIIRTPTRSTVLLLVLSVIVGGLTIFSLAAALIGTLFGWRTARKLSGRLAHLSQTTAAWGRGDFERDIQDAEADEIGDLGQNLNRVAAELQELLAGKEQMAVLEERNRMARELHDTLAQGVAGMILQLEAVKHHLESGHYERAETIVGQAMERARGTLANSRAAIDDLRLHSAEITLFESIRRKVDRFTAATGISCDLVLDLPEQITIAPQVSQHVEPFVGEGLANIARHARASQAWVRLAQVGEALEITMRDDGRGFDIEEATRPGHYGLLGMRERVRLAGGTFVIDSAPERGTRITVRLPLNPVEATEEG
jgi:signal transduction histidine kinase